MIFGACPLDETSDAGEWGRDRNQQESAGITDLHTVQEKNQIQAELEKVQQELGKQPEPGKVKTRLAERTSPEWAAALAEAFLRDAVERWADFPATTTRAARCFKR